MGLEKIIQQLLPENLRTKLELVRKSWLLELWFRNTFRFNKKRVGFGIIIDDEKTLGNRKWYVDPIVNYINRHSKKYVCNLYFSQLEDFSDYSIIVVIKFIPSKYASGKFFQYLKKYNIVMIYVTSDNIVMPQTYLNSPYFIREVHHVVTQNPLSEKELLELTPKVSFIRSPVITKKYKKHYPRKNKTVTIYWDGYAGYLESNKKIINPIILKLAKEVDCDLQMIYFVNAPAGEEGIIKYVSYDVTKWEDMLVSADIAVTVKPSDDETCQRKPATKVQAYMAVGLPVVCEPSEADKITIEHGKTGFFAFSAEEWHKYLKLLIENPQLRKQIGQAARKSILEEAGIPVVAEKYMMLFDRLTDK